MLQQVPTEVLTKALADARELGDAMVRLEEGGLVPRRTVQVELENRGCPLEDFAPWMRGSEPQYAEALTDDLDDWAAHPERQANPRSRSVISAEWAGYKDHFTSPTGALVVLLDNRVLMNGMETRWVAITDIPDGVQIEAPLATLADWAEYVKAIREGAGF